MFHACVQRFDGMNEKILGRELNRVLVPKSLDALSDFPSHQICRRMHEVLNIDENKN